MKTQPLAVIREADCIGCTKCIQACPVDAILGSAKKMHTVIADECIGCKLCLPPCPVDCIDLVFSSPLDKPDERKQRVIQIKKRHTARQKRLQKQDEQQYPSLTSLLHPQTYIQEAVARVKLQKLTTKR